MHDPRDPQARPLSAADSAERRRVLGCSPFLKRLVDRHPDWLETLDAEDRLEEDIPPDPARLAREIEREGLDPGLRRFRNQEMLRITWREIARSASLEQTFADLGRLAEICLQAALDRHDARLRERYGTPRDSHGEEQRLVVLGLGKLGGGELNLSSDIDVIFCYPSAGQCDGRRGLANEQYFTRLARALVGSLSEVTEHGFCFRVDTRLRPFGEAGPLTCSFGALEQYYQREGRDWERYALVKARPVAGDRSAGAGLLEALRPFVYRRYIDFGAVEALREMLASIRADAARVDRGDDVKRGPGGIREVEFLVQCLQILRGGREPGLRTPSLLAALGELEELQLLPAERVRALREDYAFLRHTENAIQALHDQQTHRLPAGEDLARVARIMGFSEMEDFVRRLGETRDRVRRSLEESFPAPPGSDAPGGDWPRRLAAGKFGESAQGFLERLGRTAMSRRARQRLDRFMGLLIESAERRDLDRETQRDLLSLVLAVCRRSAYLALLVQNPPALERMLDLFESSGWIARAVIRHPALLDDMIAPASGGGPPDRAALTATLERLAGRAADPESALLELNHAKQAQSLRIAVAELSELDAGAGTRAVPASERLTTLAEVLVGGCLDLAERLMIERHGRLPGPPLAVIGYGTLGGRDMSYASDLDLVFLYGAADGRSDGARPLSAEQYHTRLVRRFLSLCTLTTPAGRLYEVDTRLRPNGRAGLLVSSLDAFRRYQLEQAWTWELQALVRARPVAGDEALGRRFEAIRREVLSMPRDPGQLRPEVADMRERLREAMADGDRLKHGSGGLLDIDFLAQLGVLECAAEQPEVLESTATADQLLALGRVGWLPAHEAEQLAAAHAALARARHLQALSRREAPAPPDRALGARVFERFFP